MSVGQATPPPPEELMLNEELTLAALDVRLMETIQNIQLRSLFPVQRSVLSRAKTGSFEQDVCISAPTGSGKTLSYLLPIMQILSKRVPGNEIVGVVVVPSSDLANQVCIAASKLCEGIGVQVTILDRPDFSCRSQSRSGSQFQRKRRIIRQYRSGEQFWGSAHVNRYAQISVTTPGKFAACATALRHVKILVIDEVDKMLQQSHQNWLQILESEFCRRREHVFDTPLGERTCGRLQVLVCSATLKTSDLQIIRLFAPDQVNNYSSRSPELPRSISEYVVFTVGDKFSTLLTMLRLLKRRKVLIFTASTARAAYLYNQLRSIESILCFEYDSMMSQRDRARALRAFESSDSGVLVASDAASRGLDVVDVSVVISFDVPEHFETYLHRAGRTGRAGVYGTCVTLCSSVEVNRLQRSVQSERHVISLSAEQFGQLVT